MLDMFSAWSAEAEKFQNGEITKEEYDRWRYTYPKIENERKKAVLDNLRASKRNNTDN